MFSSRVVSVSTSSVKRSAKPSRICSTSISGAEAPAVIATALGAFEQPEIERLDARHQQRDLAALALGDLAQALRVGGIGGADDDDRVDLLRRRLHRLLAVGGGVADVLDRAAPGSCGNLAFSAAMTSRVSSTESVVWVTKASSLPSGAPAPRRRARRRPG